MLLKVSDLRKTYTTEQQGRVDVVNVGAFALKPGEQLALRGASGCGKTTFLHLIAGIIRPDSGSIRWEGAELVGLSEARRDAWRARHLGYVHQSFNLLQGLSALENVKVAHQLAGGRDLEAPRRLLERVGLGDRLHHRPAQLSAGQQQRVAVARALVNRPGLVLADEPTAALDPANREAVLGLLRTACSESGAALLLVSHDDAVLSAFESVMDFTALNTPGVPA